MNYRIPGIDSAIKSLRPDAKYDLVNKTFVVWKCPNGSEPPSWDEIEQRIQEDVEVYNYYAYARNREKEYGDWKHQLNMLYDDIKSGNLENGSWITFVEEIRSRHPKPNLTL